MARKPRKEITLRLSKNARNKMEKLFELMDCRDELKIIRQSLELFCFILRERKKGTEFFWRKYEAYAADENAEPEEIDFLDYVSDEN